MISSAILNQSNKATISDVKKPFQQGTFRWVAKGRYTEGPRNGQEQECVAKWFKTGAVMTNDFFDMDIKAVGKAQVKKWAGH